MSDEDFENDAINVLDDGDNEERSWWGSTSNFKRRVHL